MGIVVVRYVLYTEIDWVAYMQEVAGVLEHGEFDYRNLKGDTGPLVYPAGFVYVYSLLYWITDKGHDIPTAQGIFVALQATLLALVIYIYRRCQRDGSTVNRLPFWIITLLPLSRRVMSLFVLRLFNDGVQMLFMYAAIALFVNNYWGLGCLIYSFSVSIKMNGLLFAPGLAVLLCQARGFVGALKYILGICLTSQLVLGMPFLIHAPESYLARAYELTRQFLYKWSVNGAFLSESTFLDKRLAITLLLFHLATLVLFGHFKWTARTEGGLFGLLQLSESQKHPLKFDALFRIRKRNLNPSHVVGVLFSCNFIGITFARTLHYQFYLWYAHSLPFLVYQAKMHSVVKVIVLLTIELVFNMFPPSAGASIALNMAHLIIIVSLWQLSRATTGTIYEQNGSKNGEPNKAN